MLGIDSLDRAVLSLLDRGSEHTSEIARRLKTGRTSVLYRLNRLQRGGFVRKTVRGRKTEWSRIYTSEHNKNRIRIYAGRDIVQAYTQFLSLPRHSTILCIQGAEAARGEFRNVPASFMHIINRVYKRKKFILKGISHEQALRAFEKAPPSVIQSHIGRTLGLRLFSGDLFLGGGEIISSEKYLLISNPSSQIAVIIKDKGIVQVMYETLWVLLEYMDGGKNFDLNQYLINRTDST